MLSSDGVLSILSAAEVALSVPPIPGSEAALAQAIADTDFDYGLTGDEPQVPIAGARYGHGGSVEDLD